MRPGGLYAKASRSGRFRTAESLTSIGTDASHRKMRNGHRGKPSELAERSRAMQARPSCLQLALHCVVLWFLPPVSRVVQRPVLCCGVGFTGERDQEFSISADGWYLEHKTGKALQAGPSTRSALVGLKLN